MWFIDVFVNSLCQPSLFLLRTLRTNVVYLYHPDGKIMKLSSILLYLYFHCPSGDVFHIAGCHIATIYSHI